MSLESKRCPANHKRTSLIYPPPSPGGNGAYSPQPSPHTHPDLAFHSTSPTILPGEVTPSGQNLFSPHRAVTRNAQDALLPTLTVAVSFFARWAAETRGRACALTAIVIAAIGFLGRPAPLCLFIGDLQTTLLPQLTPTGGVFSVFPSLVTKGYIVLPCHSRGVFALR